MQQATIRSVLMNWQECFYLLQGVADRRNARIQKMLWPGFLLRGIHFAISVNITFGLRGDNKTVFYVNIHQVILCTGFHGLIVFADDVRQFRAGDHFAAIRRKAERITRIIDLCVFIDDFRNIFAIIRLRVVR